MEDGAERHILVIVTTIELDPKHDRYSKKLVGKLRYAAEEHLAQSSEATGTSCSSADRRIGRKPETASANPPAMDDLLAMDGDETCA